MKRNETRTYQGMTYRQVQAENAAQLSKELDKLRKKHGLKNKGWGDVIELYRWLQSKAQSGEPMSDTLKDMLNGLDKIVEIESNIREIAKRYPEYNVIQFPMERVNHG